MARVIVSEFLTVDGVMQAPGGKDEDTRGGVRHGGWQLSMPEEAIGEFVIGGIQNASGLLLGRRTYEVFAAYWPNQGEDNPVAPPLNAMAKHVASRTLQEPLEWANSTLLGDDVPAAVQGLREDDGVGDLLVIGSGDLVQTLIENDLVDEYRLMVYPLLVGDGLRLFRGGDQKRPLRLTDTRTTSNGIVILTYQPGADEPGSVQGEGEE